MKKLAIAFLLFSASGYSQVMGDIANDGRAIATDIDYIIMADTTGTLVFDIVVDMDGKVTSCKVNKEMTNLNSTPLLITGKNRILQGLSFEVGYAFPKWHNGEVHFTVEKEVAEKKKKK